MVMPEREVPGISASACAAPISSASLDRQVEHAAGLAADAVGDAEHEAEHDQVRRDQGRHAQRVRGLLAHQQADDDRRNDAEREADAEAMLGTARFAAVATQHRDGDGDEVAAVVHEHRHQRAEMQGQVEGDALVGPAEQETDQAEMARTRDRQEFGQRLHQREQENVAEFHGRTCGKEADCASPVSSGRFKFGVEALAAWPAAAALRYARDRFTRSA
jgi:hypothetical protein